MRTRSIILILILQVFNPAFMHAQDLSGTWIGSATTAGYVELVIVRSGSQYVGYSYDEGFGHCKANFLGTFDTSTRKLKGKGMGFIEKTFGHGQGTFRLEYSNKDGGEFLKGNVWPKSLPAKMMSFGIPTHVTLAKKKVVVDTTEFMKQSLAAQANIKSIDNINSVHQEEIENDALVKMKESRETDTLKTIVTSERKIIIKLFDNGVEDNDIVSILHNSNVIVNRQLITSNPFVFEIALDAANDEHDITLVAHNLGSIPPNTAMVIIEAGANRYSLSATSTLSRNAMIRVRYEPGK